MSIRIRFALRPKNRLTGSREWTPEAAETMIKELAGEQGYTCESLSGCLLCRFCPEGYIWFELISDLLVTSKDVPDQAYVDALCEEIYSKLFDE